MKQTILTIAIAAVFAACGTKPTEETTTVQSSIVVQDTSGLAQFKEWKERQEAGTTQEVLSDDFQTESVVEASEPVAPKVIEPKTRVVYRNVPVREERVAKVTKPAPRVIENTGGRTSRSRDESTNTTPTQTESTAGTSVGSGSGTEASSGDVATAPAETEKQKNEGWSKAAKGTAIGGSSGAVLGAIISKNKTKGAVIGGVVGAAGGYIFGRKQDKKDGRD